MRSLGDSTYFLKATYEPLKELMGDKEYEIAKDPIRGFIVHTDRIDGELLESVDDLLNDEFGSKFRKTHYNHNIEISWRDINKYAECVTVAELIAVDPSKVVEQDNGTWGIARYTTDFTSDGQFSYPIPKLTNFATSGWGGSVFARTPAIIFRLSAPACTGGYRLLMGIQSKEIYLDAPLATAINESALKKIEIFWCNSLNITAIAYAFASPYLYSVQCEFPKLNYADNAFNKSILNKESTLRILNSIPSYTSGTHNLMIGIHVDHQTDDEVLAAIANAETKGWTLTVQWNGTSTAQTTSTFGLRKPSIYAKLSEIEQPNGTKEQILDWGHYVTNPEDYEEFSSLEEAYEHFGLSNDLEN